MSSNLLLPLGNHRQYPAMDNERDIISIDQGGEWDLSLFDELGNLGDDQELLETFNNISECPVLDFDIDILSWDAGDTGSTCTDGEVSVHSLSPAHTLSSIPSPSSVDPLSPYSLQDEALSPELQLSPVSLCSESSSFSTVSSPHKKSPKRTSQSTRAKQAQPIKRPLQIGPKVSIQPKPLIAAVPLARAAAPLQAKTIIIQPVQTTVLPIVKPAPISIQPAPPTGRPIVLSQTGQVLQIQTPQPVAGSVLTLPTLAQDSRPAPVAAAAAVAVAAAAAAPPVVSVSFANPSSDEDSKISQRQQRMIKNRESASLSRRKKKEYLLSLEARLKLALSENEALKCENGNLKRQLEGLLCENTVLNAKVPKRRAVCLMAVLLFLVLNVGQMSFYRSSSGHQVYSVPHTGRHLLESSEAQAEEATASKPLVGGGDDSGPSAIVDSSEDKALMVVKDPVFLRPPPPCQPPVNRTKCLELTHELRGWVHRHEVQQTKSRRSSNGSHKPTKTILKTENKEAPSAQIVTVQYTDTEEKNPGSELQVYYAPHHSYSDFFEELHRRGDTFYVVSFRKDHLLLPATSHNKGRRPKMSVVLPAMNINESIIRDKDYEVMMQIDCEVTDTRILHIRSSTIPPLLRVNQTETVYQPSPADNQATPPVGVLMGSA